MEALQYKFLYQSNIFLVSGNVENAASGFSNTAVLPIFAPISKNLPGFSLIFVFKNLPILCEVCPKLLQNLPGLSALIVLSLTEIDFFKLPLAQLPNNNFLPLGVLSLKRAFVPAQWRAPGKLKLSLFFDSCFMFYNIIFNKF